MRIQPRQELLAIWRSLADVSWADGKWAWPTRTDPNSISGAEQVLCLMYPATVVAPFKLDVPDVTAPDVAQALRRLGHSGTIPQVLVRVLTEYYQEYSDATGSPLFSGGSYFTGTSSDAEPTDAQRATDVVDSFSMSVTLTLATIGFVRVFRRSVQRPALLEELDTLEALASTRLTAAMIGLLRSFSVNTFRSDSDEGARLCRTAGAPGGRAEGRTRAVVERLQEALRPVNAGLRDLSIGSSVGPALDDPGNLFECGWAWGVIGGAPAIDTTDTIGPQRPGHAVNRPYLYFTVVALDGIADLSSPRTQVLQLLNAEQIRLAQALQVRWELVQRYWSTVATLGSGRWPLEDIPWRTTDGEESEYFSLLVTSVVVENLYRERGTDTDLTRVGLVLEELATRARINRRIAAGDPAVMFHEPGVQLNLDSTAGGPPLAWVVSDYAVLLLKRAIRVARLARGTELRGRLLMLADETWAHLSARRIASDGAVGLWDQPSNVFPGAAMSSKDPSWYFTERVVEALVATADVVLAAPLRSEPLHQNALDLLNEAEHLYDQELLRGSDRGEDLTRTLERLGLTLRRCREIMDGRPGTAVALASEVVRELDALATARQRAAEET